MTDTDALLAELRRTLPTGSMSYTRASKPWDVYEGFIFTLAVQAAAEARAHVEFLDVDGNSTRDLVFRTSPGKIDSRRRAYTHALVTFPTTAPPLEVHVGVKVEGTSRVAHECDVLILWSDEAEYCRQSSSLPRNKYCIAAAECKYYSTPPTLGTARAFEGLCADLSQKSKPVLVTNGANQSSVTYLQNRKRAWEQNVLPGAQQVDQLKSKFRSALRDHVVAFDPSYDI